MNVLEFEKLDELDYRSKEAYKGLRTNIQLCGEEIKVIMFTSATPNEGKSSVSFRLAMSLAESGKQVLFMDADLRKSVIAGRYNIHKEYNGLSQYLSGMCKLEDAICVTNIPHLYTMLAGPTPPNPAELLSNKKFEFLIKVLSDTYDYVIIDTPPLGSVIDSAIVAQVCDGVALVISANTISYKFIQSTLDQLKKTKCKLLGAVLNKVDLSENAYYGNYYGRYYGRYYGKYGENE